MVEPTVPAEQRDLEAHRIHSEVGGALHSFIISLKSKSKRGFLLQYAVCTNPWKLEVDVALGRRRLAEAGATLSTGRHLERRGSCRSAVVVDGRRRRSDRRDGVAGEVRRG